MMRRVYIKEEACMGCRLCEVYCQLQHSKSRDLVKAFKGETPHPLPRLRVEAKKPVFLSVRCQHCDEAPCIYACLTGALSRSPDGNAVTVDEERCVGCWICLAVCPFGAIRQDVYRQRIAKCDLCPGEDKPACVTSCPNEALIYVES